jgi:hypothetical protein
MTYCTDTIFANAIAPPAHRMLRHGPRCIHLTGAVALPTTAPFHLFGALLATCQQQCCRRLQLCSVQRPCAALSPVIAFANMVSSAHLSESYNFTP